MYRLYSDFFYNDRAIRLKFEEEFKDLIINKAQSIKVKARKNAKLISLEKMINQRLKNIRNKCSDISDLPLTLEELILLSTEKISTLYIEFCNNLIFQQTISKELGIVYGEKNGKQNVLEFSKFSKEIADFFMLPNNEKIFTISTCFYCNKTYINAYILEENKKKQQFDIDHFIAKTECPLFTLCLYNFIPSCQVCNSRIKQSGNYFKNCNSKDIEKLFPSSENYSYNTFLKFRIIPNKELYVDNNTHFDYFSEIKDSFAIEFEKLKKEEGDLYEKEAEGFDIIKRYDYHKKEFLNYIDKKRKYPPSYFISLAKLKGLNEADILKEAIFDDRFRNTEKQIFQKIYNDINFWLK